MTFATASFAACAFAQDSWVRHLTVNGAPEPAQDKATMICGLKQLEGQSTAGVIATWDTSLAVVAVRERCLQGSTAQAYK